MRQFLQVFLVLLLMPCGVAASGIPEDIHLLFEDRTLTLNFESQPELLRQVPQHFLRMGNTRILVDMEGELLSDNGFLNVETEFETEVSPEKLEEFFRAASITRDVTDKKTVEIRFDNEGEIVFEGTPHDGFEIEHEKLVHLINESMRTGKNYVRVPARKIFSDVIVHPDLEEKGIKEIIAVGESNFAGSSEARKQNILAGAARFNGYILKKGNRFSFNKILGSVEEEEGFVRELVIKGSETVKELGGGICQVSTTAYRAAFSGGLPIAARRNHSYAVPYYKPFGLDAAIYLGALDMRFRNDTPGDILVQTFTEGNNLFFVFYGTDDGREVTLEGPFISDYKEAPDALVYESEDIPLGEIEEVSEAHDGFTAEWVRRVKNKNFEEDRTFISTYRPWPAKQFIGTKKVSMSENQ